MLVPDKLYESRLTVNQHYSLYGIPRCNKKKPESEKSAAMDAVTKLGVISIKNKVEATNIHNIPIDKYKARRATKTFARCFLYTPQNVPANIIEPNEVATPVIACRAGETTGV